MNPTAHACGPSQVGCLVLPSSLCNQHQEVYSPAMALSVQVFPSIEDWSQLACILSGHPLLITRH